MSLSTHHHVHWVPFSEELSSSCGGETNKNGGLLPPSLPIMEDHLCCCHQLRKYHHCSYGHGHPPATTIVVRH
ncbi:hypothetical protein LOK49_Contig4G00020 [Camellia lanceoleosa]|nr:hypothetical protein LOK49_Contig4G00020 [Camellia lanceoleosa]